jgi:N-acetylmuramoyl-L-alanine amidase
MNVCTGALLFLAGSSLLLAEDRIIVIDPGHGGRADSGNQKEFTLSASNNAKSPSGLLEKDLTLELSLEISRKVEELVKRRGGASGKVQCVLTRTKEANPDFAERAAFCAGLPVAPSAIVSIHFNASTQHDALGSLCLIRQKGKNPRFSEDSEFAMGLAKAAGSAVSRYVPGSNPRKPITDENLHGGLGSNFLHQLARHKKLDGVAKCFLEVEFMDRTDVDKALLQNRRATFPAIAEAIAVYLIAKAN